MNKLNPSGTHDVVIVHRKGNSKSVDVKTITSLEHYRPSKKRMEYDFSALNMAKKGQFIPIPINELGSFHWSGIDQRAITIDRSKLISNPGYTKKSSLPKKYFKLIK